ncbi:uncharacterized protein LOC108741607 [Agrilus planipennis]|uniref:Uncharacterized protein LOC108741607 n=1 Tax=Agrilus planipennis TaxID=224129 RepID=A0A1W4XHN6_AGRPL|nr:uncharacterized protein LOC108741607 [Agrilus planipennis]
MSSHYFDNNVYAENNELESTILIEGIVWEQRNSQEEAAMNVNEGNKSILEDSRNETFLSVNEAGNTTEYFSVLEMTDDSVMNDLNLTAVNPTVVDESSFCQNVCEDEEATEQSNILQPILYEIEGSDEYLAVQVTCDEEGIMRRIQYRMRQNENGDLEPIVGTTEILPIDEDINLDDLQENILENEKIGKQEQVEEEDDYNDFKEVQHNSIERNPLDPQLKIKMEDHTDGTIPDFPNNSEVDPFQNDKINSQEKQSVSVIESVSNKQDWIKNEILQESSTDSDFTLDLDGLEDSYVNVMDSMECPNVQNDGPPSELFSDPTVNDNITENETNLTEHNLALTYSNSKDPDLYTHLNSEVIITRVRQGIRNFMESPDNSDDGLSSDGENAENTENSPKILKNNVKSSEDNASSSESDMGEYHLTETVENDVTTSKVLEKTNLFQVNNNTNSIKVFKSPQQQQQQSILMDKTMNSKSNGDLKTSKNQVYYVLKHPEKENVAIPRVNTNKTYKVNPRSILKTSFVQLEHQHQNETKSEIIKQENKNSTNIPIEKIDKRFARNKEIMQAILFQNYIAKTTIPHAPVRQGRMPRKQKIKPVERADEEIIVKEVAVSSEGFVEIPEENLLPKANVEIVQLSDSENDLDSKQHEHGIRQSRRYKSDVSEIIISDSEDECGETVKIVQIDLSADSDEDDNNRSDFKEKNTKKTRGRPRKNAQKAETVSNISILKRKRGRPPKKKPITDEERNNESVSSPKKQRTDESENTRSISDDTSSSKLDSSEEKAENHCPKCSKSFPSKSSLKTHLQYHTFQEASARRTNMRLTSSIPTPSERYQCHKCGEIFKNNALLNKHEKLHNSNSLECHVCHKVFTELAQLSTHKRSHVKEQMFKATVPPKISPKPCKSSKVFKTPPPLKCPVCMKTFANVLTLNTHKNNFHRQFSCRTCTKHFYSKVAWESHVKNSCVKPKSPEKRRLSLNVRKSFVVPPQPQRASRRLSVKGRRKSNGKQQPQSCVNPDLNATERTRTPAGVVKAPCNMCEVVCLSFKHLFQHKVTKHGLETPDKSVIENPVKKTLFKDRADQGGVPVTTRIGNAWAGLKNKID